MVVSFSLVHFVCVVSPGDRILERREGRQEQHSFESFIAPPSVVGYSRVRSTCQPGDKSWMGDGKQFQRGRDASVALGLLPRQFSTGGKQVLLSISKCGNRYVRSMLVHGARAVLFRADEKTDPLSVWINRIREKRGFNQAVIALANKLLRISWGEDRWP